MRCDFYFDIVKLANPVKKVGAGGLVENRIFFLLFLHRLDFLLTVIDVNGGQYGVASPVDALRIRREEVGE